MPDLLAERCLKQDFAGFADFEDRRRRFYCQAEGDFKAAVRGRRDGTVSWGRAGAAGRQGRVLAGRSVRRKAAGGKCDGRAHCERLRAFTSVCECLRVIGAKCGRFAGVCGQRRVWRDSEGRGRDFQLSILRFEEVGGRERWKWRAGRVRKGGRRALQAKGGREHIAPLVGGARQGSSGQSYTI